MKLWWFIRNLHSTMRKLPSLTTCIILDAIGMISYIIPVVGEAFDAVWAPVSAAIYFFLFGAKGALFAFIEEWLPFTDIIPTFTISYFLKKNEMSKVGLRS
jgi:hypothetical protein